MAKARPATLLFVAAASASAALLLALGSRLTFFLDDWTFLLDRPGWSADDLMLPHGEHISIVPVLVYKGLQELIGMDSSLSYRVAATAAFIASVATLFVYLRRRVGEWPALAGAAVILFLGAAWEDLLWPFQIGYFGSMACGLGMLLALDRRDRGGDLAACALLTLAIAFSSLGLPFVAGAAASILLGPRDAWLRRAYVVAVPVALFALWWIGWGQTGNNSVTWDNIATSPAFVVDGLAAGISSLLGLEAPRTDADIGPLAWGRPLLAVALALAAWRLWRLRRVPRQLIVVVAITAGFWLLAGMNETPERDPVASRYQYVGAIFVLLIAAELLRGVKLGRGALAAVFAVAVLAVAGNLAALHQGYRSFRHTTFFVRSDLAALEIARDSVAPELELVGSIAGTPSVNVQARDYLPAIDEFGSPAYTEEQLAAAPEEARQAADRVLSHALGITFDSDAQSAPRHACVAVGPGEASRLIDLPPGGAVIVAAPEAPASVRLRRFATESSPLNAGELPAGNTGVLDIPTDRSQRPWRLELGTSGAASVCARESGT